MALTELNELQGANLLIHHKCDSATEEVQSLSWNTPNTTFANNPTFNGTTSKAQFTANATAGEIFDSNVQFHALRNIPLTPSKLVISYEESGGTGHIIAGTISDSTFSFGTDILYSNDGILQKIDRINDTICVLSYRGPGGSDARLITASVAGTTLTLNPSGTILLTWETAPTNTAIAMVETSGFITLAGNTSGVLRAGQIVGNDLTDLLPASDGTETIIGEPVQFDTSMSSDRFGVNLKKLDLNKFVLVYNNASTSQGKIVVGTVDGTTVDSLGTAIPFANNGDNVDVAVLDETHGLILYNDQDVSSSIVRPFTVSGNTVTLGPSGSLSADGIHQTIVAIDRRRFLVSYADTGAGNAGITVLGSIAQDNDTIAFGTKFNHSSSATRNVNGCFDFNRCYVAGREDANNGRLHAVMGLRLDNDSTPYGNNINGNSTLAVASLMAWPPGSQGAVGIGYLNDSVDRPVAKLQTRNNAVFYNRDENDDLVVTLDYGSGIAEWFTSISVADDDQEYIISHFEFTGGNWNLKVSKNGLSYLDQGTQSGTNFFGGSGEVVVGTTPGGGCTVDEVALWAGNTEFTDENLDDLYQLVLALQSDAPAVTPRDPIDVGNNQRLAARIGVQTGSIGQNIVFGQRGVLAPGGFATVSPSGLGLGTA